MANTRFPSRFGKYILLDRVASGGMAEVYRAKVTGVADFQRLVAIKCMLPSLARDEQFIRMFVDEAKMASQLNHANIVQIFELGQIDQRLYIAMELIHGHDLRHVMRTAHQRNVKLPLGFVAYVIAKAAEGLDAAHRKKTLEGTPLNLVHRDVSPQNILVGYEGEVKVADFGIAKAEERATETRAGVLKGKFSYMAPEQVEGKSLDLRADIFPLGAILFEALAGTKLFRGKSDMSTLEKVRNAELPDLRAAIPELTPELETCLRRSLTKTPEERFQWASELAEGLEPLIIEQRSIFGAKRAAQFMHTLYAQEIDAHAANLKRYGTITHEDLVENSDLHQPTQSQVFESTFGKGVGQTPMPAPPKEVLSPDNDPEVFESNHPWDPKTVPVEISSESLRRRRSSRGSVSGSQIRSATGSSAVNVPMHMFFLGLGVFGVAALATALALQPWSESPESAAFVAGVPVEELDESDLAAPKPTPPSPPPAAPSATPPSPIAGVGTDPVSAPKDGVLSKGATEDASPPSPVTSTPPAAPASAPPTSGGAWYGAESSEAASEGREKKRRRRGDRARRSKRFGYLSVAARGVRQARIFVDGVEAGFSPLVFYRLKPGRHTIRVVEELAGGRSGKSKTLDANVTLQHTRRNPLKIMVNL